MAEPTGSAATAENAAKIKKLQTNLDKMKKVAKKLLQQKQTYESRIKKLNHENEASKQNINGLQSKLDKKDELISNLEQQIKDKNEAARQILQELNNKCVEYEQQINQIQTEKQGIQDANTKLLQEMQEFEANNATLKQSIHESVNNRQLKSQMNQMTAMMTEIQKSNAAKMDELEEKLSVSLRRTQEMTLRSQSLMELNGALKRNVKKLHCDNDELEQYVDEMQQKYMQSNQSNNNGQIMDLRSKTIGFKESIAGLKNDMEAISIAFQQQFLSSTAQFAEIHYNEVQEKNKYIAEINELNDDCQEFEKQLKTEREEKESLQQLYNALITDRKDIEQHLNHTQSEYDEYKLHETQRINEYKEKEKERERLHDINLTKAVQQNENLKKEIEKINNEISDKHETEVAIINNEKNELLHKYNGLFKTHQQTQNELDIKKKEIEELFCNNQNMQDEIVKIKQGDDAENDVEATSIILKRRQTPIPKPKSMDFSTEIHKQLKDENERLGKEINAANEQYQETAVELQTQIQKYNESQNKCDGLSESITQITQEKQTLSVKLAKYSQTLKTLMQKLKQYKAVNMKNEKIRKELQETNTKLKREYDEITKLLTEKNNDLAATNGLSEKYNELMARNEGNAKTLRALQQEIEVKNTKMNTLTEDHASATQQRQILEMEHNEMKKQNEALEQRVLELKQEKDKLKNKYKAYINKQKQNINASTQKHTDLQQKHTRLTKEYESKAIMANEYETEAIRKYESLKTEYDAIQNRYQTLSDQHQVSQSDLVQLNTQKITLEQKINEMEIAQKDAFAKYKEKAKNVINRHKVNAEKQVNEIKQKLQVITAENQVNEQSLCDLNAKLRANQNDLETLQNKLKAQIQTQQSLTTEMASLSVANDKREEALNKISVSLAECSCFNYIKSNDSESMGIDRTRSRIVEGVAALAHNYEDISIKQSESKSAASDHELKLKEQTDKIKRLAVTVRKLQALRTKLQTSLETTKLKLKQTITTSQRYHKSLQTIHCEIRRSLEKWKLFINNMNNDADNSQSTSTSVVVAMAVDANDDDVDLNETYEEYLKRCLADVRSLSMYFIQSLDMFREKNEQHQGDTSELELNLKSVQGEVENYKKELEDSRKYIESTDNSQIAKNAHIEKLNEKLNHSIQCIQENWHYDITKADFVDLAVSTRLLLEDTIWCLIRWRQKLPDIAKDNENKTPKKKKYNDEYFWCSQATYLQKLNVKENEIYLPDFFENKLENQITRSLEAKWKAIQRRTDRQIQELKSQRLEEEGNKERAEENLKQYKAKAKVILQKQKDELNAANVAVKELEAYREEASALKQQLSKLSSAKYKEIDKNLSKQKSDLQDKKLELAEIRSKLLLKERQLTIIQQEFEKEKDEIGLEFESQKMSSKKNYAKKLEDYRIRAREMLQEKDKQLAIARARLQSNANAAVYALDKETQTEHENNYTNILTSDITQMGRMQASRDQKVREIEDRLRRLQELLNTSEEEQKRKDSELNYLKSKFEQMEQAKDVKKSADNSQYLKNALLQYFDGIIDINQLVSVVAVGLRFNPDEHKKAQNSKLIVGYVKSWPWWG